MKWNGRRSVVALVDSMESKAKHKQSKGPRPRRTSWNCTTQLDWIGRDFPAKLQTSKFKRNVHKNVSKTQRNEDASHILRQGEASSNTDR